MEQKEYYQKVAYIGLRKDDGSYSLNLPLYVKVSDVNKSGVSQSQEEIIHNVSEIMTKHYERQLSEHIALLKEKKKIDNENKKLLQGETK